MPPSLWTYHSPGEQHVSSWTLELTGRQIRITEGPVDDDAQVKLYTLANEEEARRHCDDWRQAKEDEGWRLVRGEIPEDEEDEGEETVALLEDEDGEASAAEGTEEAPFGGTELSEEPEFAAEPEFAEGVDLLEEAEHREMAVVAHPRANEFFAAIRAGDLQQVRDILDEGVPAEAADEEGMNPLHVAAAAGQVEIVDCLVQEAAADVNAAEPKAGRTPLICAAQGGSVAAVARLLDAWADVHHRDREGHTALAYATRRGDQEMERILLAAGADPSA